MKVTRRQFLTGLAAASAAGCVPTPPRESATHTRETPHTAPTTITSEDVEEHGLSVDGYSFVPDVDVWTTEKGHLEPQGMGYQ